MAVMGAKLPGATVKNVKESNQGFAFLLAALTLLTGLLTGLGIANGALPNMVRNHPNWTLAAFGGAILAILLGAFGSYVSPPKTSNVGFSHSESSALAWD